MKLIYSKTKDKEFYKEYGKYRKRLSVIFEHDFPKLKFNESRGRETVRQIKKYYSSEKIIPINNNFTLRSLPQSTY